MDAVKIVLFLFGYPAAIAVIFRWVPVVREQRWKWLAIHHAGVITIVTGWAIDGMLRGVITNGTWLIVSSIWYVLGGRRQRRQAALP